MKNLMYYIFILVLILVSCDSERSKTHENSLSDNQKENRTDSVVFDCYNGFTLDNNLCSLEEFEYYDSILQLLF